MNEWIISLKLRPSTNIGLPSKNYQDSRFLNKFKIKFDKKRRSDRMTLNVFSIRPLRSYSSEQSSIIDHVIDPPVFRKNELEIISSMAF